MGVSNASRSIGLPDQAALIARAKQGDREAFSELYEPLEKPLGAFLYRLLAVREDAEDLMQETALKALESIADFPGDSSFRTWMFRLAAEAGLAHLQGKRQWDPDAVIRAGQIAGEDPGQRRKLQKRHRSGAHSTYEIREHIDFCFTSMGRTLPPEENAALLLIDVHGFTLEEAAETLGIPGELVRFRLEQARQAMIDRHESRCGLINKNGSCSQCAALDTLLHGDRRHTEQALFQIEIDPQPTAQARAETFPKRLGIVRAADPLHGEGRKIHDLLMTFTRELNGY